MHVGFFFIGRIRIIRIRLFKAGLGQPELIASIGRGGEIRTPDPLRPRDLSGLQGLRRFSRIPNIYNNWGICFRSSQQLQSDEQMQFRHSCDTAEKQAIDGPRFTEAISDQERSQKPSAFLVPYPASALNRL